MSENLVKWCDDNNLSLNVSKTKEIVIDFRKHSGGHAESFKFLGVHITNKLVSPH